MKLKNNIVYMFVRKYIYSGNVLLSSNYNNHFHPRKFIHKLQKSVKIYILENKSRCGI